MQRKYVLLFIVIIIGCLALGVIAWKQYPGSNSGTEHQSIDPMADWRTYSYPQLGYSFKAPSTYLVNINSPIPGWTFILQSLSLSVGNVESRPSDPGILVLSASSLQDGIEKIISGNAPITNEKHILINDRQWTSFNFTGSEIASREAMYVTYVNNRLYAIGDSSGGPSEITKQILRTFEFAE